jgi:uncharacterized protein (TIGR02145 family)
VAWLSFNNGVLDEGPFNNTATDFGSEGTFDRFGSPDAARNFNAARVELANSDVIDQFKTVSQWTRTESSSRQVSFKQNVFSGALQERVIITQNFNGDYCHFGIKESCGTSWNYGNQPFVVSDGEWHHFVGVVLPEETRLYVDGVLISTTSIVSDSETCTGGDIIIGSEWSGVDYNFQGDIDDVGLWDRPLDEEEILGLYLADAPIYGCTDEEACNFNPDATLDAGSCLDCSLFEERCGPGTLWDDASQLCIVANPSDTNFDGCVSMTDLLDLLTVFGTCNEVPWSCGDPLEYQGYDYETVLIGEQCWFAENLRAERYSNNEELIDGQNPITWTGAEEGAYSVFSLEQYGFLYNRYAVMDPRNVCPIGWRVSSLEDWGNLYAMSIPLGVPWGEALKSDFGWTGGWGNGEDTFGFSAVPGGMRGGDSGEFFGSVGTFHCWTTSSSGEEGVYMWIYDNSDWVFEHTSEGWNEGRSVRCLQDSE